MQNLEQILLNSFSLIALAAGLIFFFACLLSPTVRKNHPNYLLVVLVWFFALASIFAIILAGGRVGPIRSKTARAQNQMTQFATALMSYQIEYGHRPDAKDNATLTKILTALVATRQNPRNVVFFNAKRSDLDSRGELLDPWGTPYAIILGDKPTILSAGPDRQWGTPDDLKSGLKPAP